MSNARESLNKYFKIDALSRSLLLKYTNHPREIYKEQEDITESLAMLRGNILDYLLLTPDIFNEIYYVTDLEKKPSETICTITEELVKKSIHINNQQQVVQTIRRFGYRKEWPDDTIYKNFCKYATEYYEYLLESGERQVLSTHEYNIVVEAAMSLKTGFFAILLNKEKLEALGIEVHYQYIVATDIEFEGHIIPSKAAVDILLINHTNEEKNLLEGLKMPPKSILEIDLKSTSLAIHKFERHIEKLRYDIQRAFYKLLIQQSSPALKTYTYMSPALLVCPLKSPQYTKLFIFSDNDMEIALNGLEKDGVVLIHGVNTLLSRYIYFEDNGYKYDIGEKQTLETTNLWKNLI